MAQCFPKVLELGGQHEGFFLVVEHRARAEHALALFREPLAAHAHGNTTLRHTARMCLRLDLPNAPSTEAWAALARAARAQLLLGEPHVLSELPPLDAGGRRCATF